MFKRHWLSITVTSISFFGAIFCGWLLYVDIYLQAAKTDGLTVAGTIKEKSETVRRKLSDTLVWDLLKTQDKLFWDDSIQTSANAQATLSLLNGSEIKLGESSLVVLSNDNDQLSLHLKSGQMVLESTGPESTKTIKINGLTLKDSRVKTLAMRMDARKGQMTATAVSPEGNGKQYILDQNGKVEEKEIPIQLESPTPMAKFKSTDDSRVVEFLWKMPKQKEVWLEVAKDREFTKILKRISTAQLSSKLDLPAGRYYWRVNQTDSQIESLSEVRHFQILKLQSPQLLSPQQSGSITYKSEFPMVEFTWSKVDSAQGYLFQVARDPEFQNVILEEETQNNQIKTSRLSDGALYWKVTSLFGNQEQERRPSSISELEIKKSLASLPPTLLAPQENDLVDFAFYTRHQGVPFKWKSEDKDVHKFILSQEQNLESEIVSFETTEEATLVKKQLEPGVYYWAVGNRDAEGHWTYEASRPIKIAPLFPLLEGPKITSSKNEYNIVTEKEVSLKWTSIEGAKNYKIKIVRLQDQANSPVLEKVLDDTDFEGPAPKEGQYKWILTAVDKFGRDSKPTEKNFRVIESKKLAPPEFEMQGVQ